ncbi:MAG: S8 family serine peptidase [Labilithrix sp.]|nr:S8 family serine peptidase [Labilithrix sp.]
MSATKGLAYRARSRGRALARVVAVATAVAAVFVTDARPARSADPPATTHAADAVRGSPIGPALLRVLGPRAADTLAPSTGLIGALVAVPPGARAEDLGLEPVAPGIGRLRGSSQRVAAYAEAHPDLRLEVAPPLHPLMDRAAEWVLAAKAREVRAADGKGVLVGVADTGLDVTHPEMRDETGASRVAWLLDLSLEPGGVHAELEQRFGIKDDNGKVVAGRVFSKQDIDDLLTRIDNGFCDEKTGRKCAPSDEIGHGTHVAGIAASSGAKGGRYAGIAPAADVVFVRVTRGASDGIENDDLVRAVEFMFDRADAERRPMVVNLSLGSDFGPHDGTFLWEQSIASHVGPAHPGHVLIAAAGNSGSITETPIHQSVRVTPGARMRVPIRTGGAESGSVQVWVTLRRGADLKIGLEAPDGEWIAPVEAGRQVGKNTNDYNAGVIYGSNLENSPIPEGSRGAVVVWQGRWPSGLYSITLEGSGMAELYVQGLGDAGLGSERPAAFLNGVREGTINLPATHPQIIGVGCTVNRPRWSSIAGADVGLKVPVLDREGGLPIARAITSQDASSTHRDLVDGEVCWFSSAGPTASGVPKPEIAAPGALVVSALSRTAKPGSPGSVFTSATCPVTKSGSSDKRCLQIDDNHGIAIGTSMSAPVVAGVVALLLQADPTLTQEKVLALLQAGAHRFRADAPFADQSGPGEVDALASLDALDQMRNPALHLPALEQSWIALSSDYVPADGSTPMTAILELRTADGAHRGDFFESERLRPVLLVDGEPVTPAPALVRRGPGVWFFVWDPPSGLGGSRATFGATFDGAPIVAPRTLPIAPDRWTAAYPSYAKGSSCAASPGAATGGAGALVGLGVAFAALRRRRGQSSSATVTSQPCGSHTSSSGSNA